MRELLERLISSLFACYLVKPLRYLRKLEPLLKSASKNVPKTRPRVGLSSFLASQPLGSLNSNWCWLLILTFWEHPSASTRLENISHILRMPFLKIHLTLQSKWPPNKLKCTKKLSSHPMAKVPLALKNTPKINLPSSKKSLRWLRKQPLKKDKTP